jgi:hypothetical protein
MIVRRLTIEVITDGGSPVRVICSGLLINDMRERATIILLFMRIDSVRNWSSFLLT